LNSFLLGFGERPKGDEKETVVKERVIYKDPDTQFSKSYSVYLESKRSHYFKHRNMAIAMFEDYIQLYPNHDKHIDGIYILARLYKESQNNVKSTEYLNEYFKLAKQDDFYYKFALHQQADQFLRSGKITSANIILETLFEDEKDDIYFKRDVASSLIPIYTRQKNKQKLIISYEYLLSNSKFIKNNDLINSYRYKLAILYIDRNRIENAKMMFKLILNDRDYKNKSIRESAKRKLDGL